MPRCCVAAGCNIVSGEGYSLHAFLRDESLCTKWIRGIKRQRSNWEGPSVHSLLCSKHVKPNSFASKGVHYCDAIGLPMKKCLKPDAIPTIILFHLQWEETNHSSPWTGSREETAKSS